MLTSISVTNFKSYVEATLPLAPMTFLVGANASGKSNILEAIRLLQWLARGSRLDDVTRTTDLGATVVRGQTADVFREPAAPLGFAVTWDGAPEGWNQFSLGLQTREQHLLVASEKVTKSDDTMPLYWVDGEPSVYNDEIRVAYNNFSRGRNKPHIPCSSRQAIFYQLETPGRFGAKHERAQQEIPAVTKSLRETLRNIVFLDPRPATMRDYVHASDDVIREDGSNLSAVLYRVVATPEGRQALLDFIRSLPEQDIVDIGFIETARRDVMVQLVESFGARQRPVDAPLLSDGTVRVLAIAATLLTAPEGALIIIEEVDNGVHPSRAELLVEQIRQVAAQRQLRVLLTTHNPALLDALPDAALEDVVCCYRDPQEGDSRLVRLGDLERYPELVAQGSLGQLVTKRILERFVKDERTAEQRQAQALDWLQALRLSVTDAKDEA